MDLIAFYSVVSGLSFTLLGLWWVVAQRHKEWFFVPERRRMAYVVSLQFMLPGSMSLLSLVDPLSSAFWRVVFTLAGLAGIVGAVLMSDAIRIEFGRGRLGALLLGIGLPVYALVVLIAVAPDVSTLVSLEPRQAEGVLMALVVLLGINAAWFLTMEPTEEERRAHEESLPASDGRAPETD
jgi:hypothetical protein